MEWPDHDHTHVLAKRAESRILEALGVGKEHSLDEKSHLVQEQTCFLLKHSRTLIN